MKVKREKATNSKNHYVTNATLLPAVIRAKELGVVTDELIKMIYLIAERLSYKSNFVGYTYRADMVCLAVMNLCNVNNALKFDPARGSNPFTYYTTAIYNSFLQLMADEKKHRNIRDLLLVEAGANPSFGYVESVKNELADDESTAHLDSSSEEGFSKSARQLKYEGQRPSDVTYYGPHSVEVDENGHGHIKEGAKGLKQKYVEPEGGFKKRSPFNRKKKVETESPEDSATPKKEIKSKKASS